MLCQFKSKRKYVCYANDKRCNSFLFTRLSLSVFAVSLGGFFGVFLLRQFWKKIQLVKDTKST